MIKLSDRIVIPDSEIEIKAIRSQGAGGQNVNKVATAICLFFDICNSSLPEQVKGRLLALHDTRISKEGVLVIKSQQHRSQEMNREDALLRLRLLVKSVMVQPKKRKPTKPSRSSQQKRMNRKIHRGQIKSLRKKVRE